MYKSRLIRHSVSSDEVRNPFCPDLRIARPVSYYVRGGVDLDGITARPPLPSSFDSPDEVSDGLVDIGTDARVSRLDIAAEASKAYRSASEKRALAELNPDANAE
nr:MAG TPA: hypothetical protein [Microviridae sp.]